MAGVSSQSIGQYLQLAGIGAFLAGAVLSLHHIAIAICFLTGSTAFFLGQKLKTS
jgi:hypothetical protein